MTSCTFLYTFGPLVWFNLGPSAVPLPSQAMGRGPREQRKSCSCKRLSRRADPCSMGRDHLPGTRATVAPPPRQLLSALPRPPQGPPRRTAPAPGWWPRQGLLASEVWPSLCSSELAFHGSKRNSTQVYTERRTDLDNRVLRSIYHMPPACTNNSQSTWDNKTGKQGEVNQLNTVDKSKNRINFKILLYVSDFQTVILWNIGIFIRTFVPI